MNVLKYYGFRFSLFIISAVLITACATGSQKRSFSQQFYKDSGLSQEDLKRVQAMECFDKGEPGILKEFPVPDLIIICNSSSSKPLRS